MDESVAKAPPVLWRSRATGLIKAFLEGETPFLVGILVGLIIVFTVLSPDGSFLTSSNIRNIGLDTAEIAIEAAGMTFVIIAGGVDLSIGAVVVFATVAFAEVLTHVAGTTGAFGGEAHHLGLAIALAVAAAILSGGGWGAVNGFLAGYAKIPAFIVTLGTLGIALGLAQVISGGANVAGVPPALQSSLGTGRAFGAVPWIIVIAAAVIGVLWVVLAKTRYGMRTYAVGASVEAAARAGVNVRRHIASVYILMGVLVGIVGVLDVARFDTASIAAHTTDNLNAIAAVVIGGTSLFGGRGRMSGTLVGALIPAVLKNGFVLIGVEPFWQNVAVGWVLILAVYVDQARRRRARLV